MAKRSTEDMDLEDNYNDGAYGDDMDFGEFDFDEVTPKRSPVTRFVGGVVGGVPKSALSRENRKKFLREAMPDGYELAYDTAEETLSDIGELYDIVKEKGVGPLKKTLKRFTRTATSAFKVNTESKGIMGKLARWAQDDDRHYEAVDPEAAEMQMAMAEIFGQQQKTHQGMDELKTQIKEGQEEQTTAIAAQNMQLMGSNQLLSKIAKSTDRLAVYQDQISINFQRRSLELQYRQLFISKKSADIHNQTFELLKGGIETLAHNTALPDILKTHKSELASQMLKEKAFSSIVDGTSVKFSAIRKRIFSKAKTKLNDFFKDFGASATMVLDGVGQGIVDMTSSEGMADPLELAGESAGGAAGNWITKKIIGLVGNRFKDNESLAATGLSLKNAINNMDPHLRRIMDSRTDTGNRFIEMIKNMLGGDLVDQQSLLAKDNQFKTLDKQTQFDTLTKRTITDVIPAFLSSINAEIWKLRNGVKEGGELMWNFETSQLVSKKDMKQYAISKVYNTSKAKQVVDTTAALLKQIDPTQSLLTEDRKNLSKYIQKISREGKDILWIKLAAGTDPDLKGTPDSIQRIADTVRTTLMITPQQIARADDSKFSFTDATHGQSLKQQQIISKIRTAESSARSAHGEDMLKTVDHLNFAGYTALLREAGLLKHEGDQDVLNLEAIDNRLADEASRKYDTETDPTQQKMDERRRKWRKSIEEGNPNRQYSDAEIDQMIDVRIAQEDRVVQDDRAKRKLRETLFNAANSISGGRLNARGITADNFSEKLSEFSGKKLGKFNDFLKEQGIDSAKLSDDAKQKLKQKFGQLSQAQENAANSTSDDLRTKYAKRMQSFIEEAKKFADSGHAPQTEAGVHHTGGLIGKPKSKRKIGLSAFQGGQRYHSGGIAGRMDNYSEINGDEVPAILQHNEEVLTRSDPRHRSNILKSVSNVLNRLGNWTNNQRKLITEALMPSGVKPEPVVAGHPVKPPEPVDPTAFVGPVKKKPLEELLDVTKEILNTQILTYELLQQKAIYGGMPESFFNKLKRKSGAAKDYLKKQFARTKELLKDAPKSVKATWGRFKDTFGQAKGSLAERLKGKPLDTLKSIGDWSKRQFLKAKNGFMSLKEWSKLDREGKIAKIKDFLTTMKIKYNELKFEAFVKAIEAKGWLDEKVPSWKDLKESLREVGIKTSFTIANGVMSAVSGARKLSDWIGSKLSGVTSRMSWLTKFASYPIADEETWKQMTPEQREQTLMAFVVSAGLKDDETTKQAILAIAADKQWLGDTPPMSKDILTTLRDNGYQVKDPKRFFDKLKDLGKQFGRKALDLTKRMPFGQVVTTVATKYMQLRSTLEKWKANSDALADPIMEQAQWAALKAAERRAAIFAWLDTAAPNWNKKLKPELTKVFTKQGYGQKKTEVPTGLDIKELVEPFGIVIKSQPKGIKGKLAGLLAKPAELLKSSAKAAMKAPAALFKGIWSGIKKAGSFVKGLFAFKSFSLAGMESDVNSITSELEGLKKIYRVNLMMYNILSKSQQPKKKAPKNRLDSDGDGVRDGSVADQLSKRSKMAQWLADKKALAAEKFGKVKDSIKEKGSKLMEKGKGMFGDLLGKLPLKTMLAGGLLGGYLGGKFFKNEDGSVNGKNVAIGAAAGIPAAMALKAGGMWGLRKLGGFALRTALPAIAEGAVAAGTALAGVLTAPVLLAGAAIALTIGAGYLAYKALTKDRSVIANFRMVQYGFKLSDKKYSAAILTLEKDLLKNGVTVTDKNATIKGGRNPEEYMQLFGVKVDKPSDVKEWVQWFHYRFKPVFLSHMVALKKHAKSSDLHKADKLMGRTEKLAYLKDVHYLRKVGSPYSVMEHPFASEPWFSGLEDQGDVNDAYKEAVERASTEPEKTGNATAEEKKETDQKVKDAKKAKDNANKADKDKSKDKDTSVQWSKYLSTKPLSDAVDAAKSSIKGLYNKSVDGLSNFMTRTHDQFTKVTDRVSNTVAQYKTVGAGKGWSSKMRPDLFQDISDAAKRYGVPEHYLRTMAWIESKGDPTASNPASSAKGIYQFVDGTAKAYGIAGKQLDQKANVDAGARFALDNIKQLRKILGRDPEPYELYMAHQQGAGGFSAISKNPNSPLSALLSPDAIRNNLGQPNMTGAQFKEVWRKKYDEAAAKAGVSATVTDVLNNKVDGLGDAAANAVGAAKTAATLPAAIGVAAGAKVAQGASNAVSSAADAAKSMYNQAVDATSRGTENAANVAKDVGTSVKNISAELVALGKKVIRKLSPSVNIEGLKPNFRDALYAMCAEYHKATGKTLLVTSGYRSRAEQQVLWEKSQRGGPKAAQPGNSLHETGLAVDIDNKATGGADAVERLGIAAKYGFYRPFKNAVGKSKELWHFENHFYARGKTTKLDESTPKPALLNAPSVASGKPITSPTVPSAPIGVKGSDKPTSTAPVPMAASAPMVGPQGQSIATQTGKAATGTAMSKERMDAITQKATMDIAIATQSIDKKMSELITEVKRLNPANPPARAPNNVKAITPPAASGGKSIAERQSPIDMLLH